MSTPETAGRRQYLSFRLAGNDFAVGILKVQEILRYETVTQVPSVPSFIRGVLNLRGAVVPVLDMAMKFGREPTAITKHTCILIVETVMGRRRVVMGVVVDAVREVLELGKEEIEPPPTFGEHVKVDFLLGMGKAGKGFVLLLDLDRVISASEKELAAQIELMGSAGAESPVPPAPSAGEAKSAAPEASPG